MADYRVLVSCPLIQDAMDEYHERLKSKGITYDIVEVDQQLTEPELLDIIDRYHGVIAGDDEFSRPVLEAAENLEVIAKWGIGTDRIDHEAADEFGVRVLNTPGAFADEVADVVLGYAVLLTRKLHLIDRSVRAGSWDCPRGVSLGGKTCGVIGVGSIGSAVVRRTHAVGMDVLGNDVRQLPSDLVKETGIESVTCEELLSRSDFVSLNCALTDATREMIGRSELDRLGKGGYLINTARGGLIDEPALVDALREDRIAGAALDVFSEEPLPSDHPLTGLENVILGSHNAQNTQEAVDRVNDRAVENLIEGLTGVV